MSGFVGALGGIAKGAATGAALGPIGAILGGVLGGAPEVLSALGVHIFDENTANAALGVVKAFTGKDDPTAADLAGLTGDQKVQLQVQMASIAAAREKAESDADAADRKADYDELKAQLDDVSSARAQTVSLAQAGSRIAWAAPVVSVLVVLMFGAMLAALAMHAVPDESRSLMEVMLGVLATAFGSVVQYWIGSSAGSHAKDATIHAAMTKSS